MGQTDIDLLVDKMHASQLDLVFLEHGLKRAYPADKSGDPGIEDWIGFDHATGAFCHIHLHYQIFAGLYRVKEYRLPWEKIILESRIKNQDTGVWVTDPNLEIVLLLSRMAVKTNRLELSWSRLRRKRYLEGMFEELNWLRARTSQHEIQRYATKLYGEEVGTFVAIAVSEVAANTWRLLFALRHRVRKRLSPYSRYGSFQLRLCRCKFAVDFIRQRLRRYLGSGERRKRLHTGGQIIAIIGSDGAGKSTLAKDLTSSLAWKLDAYYYYLGEGTGSAAATAMGSIHKNLKRVFQIFFGESMTKGRVSTEAKSPETEDQAPSVGFVGYAKKQIFALERIIKVWERQRKLYRLHRARSNGAIIVTDRYPQSLIYGYFDGPRFEEGVTQRHTLSRIAASYEKKFYDAARRMGPDLVVRLHVAEDVARARKPDHGIDMLKKKIAALPKISFSETKQTDIDAAAPLDSVKLEVKTWVWKNL